MEQYKTFANAKPNQTTPCAESNNDIAKQYSDRTAKSGGRLRYGDQRPRYLKGDPEKAGPLVHYNLNTTEWQFRILEEIRQCPGYCVTFHTLTYAQEPKSDDQARRHLTNYLARLKRYAQCVILPAAQDCLEDKELRTDERLKAQHVVRVDANIRYFAALEYGSKSNRKHFHMLTFFPTYMSYSIWNTKMLQWRHGFHDHKLLDPDRSSKLGWYLAKYVSKSNGRTRCSLNFGLTTLTALMSLASYRLLYLMAPRLAQTLLRRLLLTPNYPTSRKMSSLISSPKPLITSLPATIQRMVPQLTGELNSLKQLGLSEDAELRNIVRNESARRALSIQLVRETIIQVKALSAEALGYPVPKTPGLRTFGRSRPVSLSLLVEPNQEAAIWFRTSNYPRTARNRASRAIVQHTELGAAPQ